MNGGWLIFLALGGQKPGKKKWFSLSWQLEEGSNFLMLEKLREKTLQMPFHQSFKDSRVQQTPNFVFGPIKMLRERAWVVMAKRPWSLMCLNGRGKVKGINSCLRKEIQGMVGDAGSAPPQTQVHLALQDHGSSSP